MTVYFCDGEKECYVKSGCFKNGGECYHTLDPKHAINGECPDPENHTEKFVKLNDAWFEVTKKN